MVRHALVGSARWVPRESLQSIADVSMEDWFVRDNPRPVRDAAELRQVLEEAW